MRYLKKRRAELGGSIPRRRQTFTGPLTVPGVELFSQLLEGSGGRDISTTMAFVRILNALLKDTNVGERIVPIVPDEARTFGMEGLFRQVGIYAHEGQKYVPQDKDQVAYYREDIRGQVLQEGINELGAMSSWLAAATAYSNLDLPMIPFYIFYSMFGFQRVGDMAWASGDARARGFLMGGTAGRTTLNGEGLQHQDGHGLLLASTIPACVSYDPAYAYEMAVIIADGLRRMFVNQEDVFYYITCMNENYAHPAMPEGAEEGIRRGIYRLESLDGGAAKVQLLGSGTILLQVREAARLLSTEFGVACDVFSATSFTELARDGLAAERWNLLHPDAQKRVPWISGMLSPGVVTVAATDYMKACADQVRAFVPGPYVVLGTDGFGRSDSRANLRAHFEVDAAHIAFFAVSALCAQGILPGDALTAARAKFNIDPDREHPLTA